MSDTPTYSGGAADRRRRGMKAVTVPLTPDLHARVVRAAADCDPPMPVTRWIASILDAKLSMIETPKKKSKKKSEEP